jgi:hypothetical protein
MERVLRRCGAAGIAVALMGCGGGSSGNSATSTNSSSVSSSSSSATASSASSASPTAGAQLDPCQLVTTDEVAAYLNGRVTATAADSKDCDFANQAGGLIRVTVSTGRANFDSDTQHFSGTPVTGIGDAAFLAQPNGIVEFVKGQNIVRLQTRSSLISPDDVNGLEDLAKKAAARA